MHLLIRGVLASCMLFVLVWAVWPQSLPSESALLPDDGLASQENHSGSQAPEQTSITEFNATLWYAPKPVAQPETVQAPRTQPRLELLAISSTAGGTSGEMISCLVYDPEGDEVHTLRVGDEVHGYRVEKIDHAGVTMLGARNAAVRLPLDDGGAD